MATPPNIQAATAGVLQIWRPVSASREALFRACSTAEGLQSWQADVAEPIGEPLTGVRLGWPDLDAWVELTREESESDSSVTWRGPSSRTRLCVADGGVRVEHQSLELQLDESGVRSSWSIALSLLAHALERHAGAPRRVAWLSTVAPCTAASLHPWLTRPELLSRWLTRSGEVGAPGSEHRLELRSGRSLAGRVLGNVADGDLALSIEASGDAAITIRSLPSDRPSCRTLAVSWSQWGGVLPSAVLSELRRALDELRGELEGLAIERASAALLH